MNRAYCETDTITLEIQDYCASSLITALESRENPLRNVQWKTMLDYQIQNQAYLLVNMFRAPVDVLQQERVIAEYPDGLWQHIRSVFTDNYRRIQVRLTEHLLFPEVAMPHRLDKEYRVYIQEGITAYDPSKDEEEFF